MKVSNKNDFAFSKNKNESEKKDKDCNHKIHSIDNVNNNENKEPFISDLNHYKNKIFNPPKIDIDCLNENSTITSNSTPTLKENGNFLFNQKHIQNNLIKENINEYQFNNILSNNNFTFCDENGDNMDYLFKETAHFHYDNNIIQTEPCEREINKNKKITPPNSTKNNRQIKYNLIEEANQKNIIKTPKNIHLKRPITQRQKISFNNNNNNNGNIYNNLKNNNSNNKNEKVNNIVNQKKVEKELNNLIHSLPSDLYKDVVIKNKFSAIMKNIDEIKQVVKKKCLKKEYIQKGNEKIIPKEQKIKSNLIQFKK